MQHNPHTKVKTVIVPKTPGSTIYKNRSETTGIARSVDHDDKWIEFIDDRAKAHGLFPHVEESNRLDFPPSDSDVPPLAGEEEMELNFTQAQREEEEQQRMMELYGPKPGRFETEWN